MNLVNLVNQHLYLSTQALIPLQPQNLTAIMASSNLPLEIASTIQSASINRSLSNPPPPPPSKTNPTTKSTTKKKKTSPTPSSNHFLDDRASPLYQI
jgi:hypothetical protein